MLFCRHNSTYNDPEWRVINGTQVIYRGITFLDSTLEAHSVIVNTNVLEIIKIEFLQYVFHGLRYLCLYDTSLGEKESNEVTVKLHGRWMCACLCACVRVCVHLYAMHMYWMSTIYTYMYVAVILILNKLNRATPSERAYGQIRWLHHGQHHLATRWGCVQPDNHTAPAQQ